MYKVKTIFMNATILWTVSKTIEVNNLTGYAIGSVVALFILGYLICSLIKPEKF